MRRTPRHAAAAADPASSLAARWRALDEAAGAVARLAGLAAVPPDPGLAERLGRAGGARARIAARAVDDLAAIMAPGIAALLAAHAAGVAPVAAARALWREFEQARAALLALAALDA